MSFRTFVISTTILPLALGTQACAQSTEEANTSKEVVVSVVSVTPETPIMTLEEIRVEQEIIEAKMAEIKAKGELERADKIALLNLNDRRFVLMELHQQYLDATIKQQKETLKNEFTSVREQIKN